MANQMTMSNLGFKVEDCTNRDIRYQSEILKEGAEISTHSDTVVAPVSHTPMQLKSFLQELRDNSSSAEEKSAFNAIISIIDDREVLKKEKAVRLVREMQTDEEEMPTDI